MSGPEAPPRAVLFETAEDGLMARAVAGGGSDALAVVFSQVRVPAGRFGLSRLFARTRHACLFLNQPSAAWYRGAADAVDRAVARALEATGARRVVLYGSSMGGFGALAAAPRWPEATAIAFAPDFAIGDPGSRSAREGLAPRPGEAALPDLLRAERRAATHLLIGLFDPYDAGVFARLAAAGLPGRVRLTPVASGHEVHDHLYTVNVIRRIIGGFARDPAAAVGERGLLPADPDPGRLARFAALGAALGRGETVDAAAVRALGLDGNPGARLLEADAEAAAGNLAAAERILAGLDRTIAASPTLASLPKRWRKRVPRRRIALLRRLGRPEEAAAVAAEAAARFGDASLAAGDHPAEPA